MLRVAAGRVAVEAHHHYAASSVMYSRRCHGNSKSKIRTNELGIQMLSSEMHSQIFKKSPGKASLNKLEEIKKHLKAHNLLNKTTTTEENVSFKLPHMRGDNLDEHFRLIADDINRPYLELVQTLLTFPIHKPPEQWAMVPGWTHYDPRTGKSRPVDSPSCRAMVFDVEVLMTDGEYPTMATAVGEDGWYSWCSKRVIDEVHRSNGTQQGLEDLINLKSETLKADDMMKEPPVLIVGHNVGFDRSFIKEQFCITHTNTKFLDTMAMHIAVAGLTSMQRVLYKGSKKEDGGMGQKAVREYTENAKQRKTFPTFRWTTESSMNNLHDVHALYCAHETRLKKSIRDVFVKGTMADVREEYQELMTYCATDVAATLSVFRSLWPQFRERLPHPVTLAGMLEMGSTYLPINQNWHRYVQSCKETSQRFETKQRDMLMKLAEDVKNMPEEEYKKDIWLWDLDWKIKNRTIHPDTVIDNSEMKDDNKKENKKKKSKLNKHKDLKTPKVRKMRLPTWYAELCPGPKEFGEYPPGPSKISTLRRTTPKLLRLTWNMYPLHYHDEYKWGYLVPEEALIQSKVEQYLKAFHHSEEEDEDFIEAEEVLSEDDELSSDFPLETFKEFCRSIPALESRETDHPVIKQIFSLEEEIKAIEKKLADSMDESSMKRALYALDSTTKKLKKAVNVAAKKTEENQGGDYSIDIGFPGVRFFRLPHKDGPNKPVGNPLAKDFLHRIEDGSLQSAGGLGIDNILQCTKTTSYWKMNKKRILAQRAIRLTEQYLPAAIRSANNYEPGSTHVGAILPQLCTAGTVTRRAVEPTWLTASNAYADRVGSELKAMVQSPPGYCFVGADVDSQELWIAALIGDSYFGGVHGCTAFGWMTLQGNKADGTDLHSKTASLVGISRDQAKVFNYGRIYGAGVRFAATLLKQFNPSISLEEAKAKARAMYAATKGKKRRIVSYESPRTVLSDDEAWDQYADLGSGLDENDTTFTPAYEPWQGGTESAMFNKLEQIALMQKPRTPVLECSISKVLEPHNVLNEFMTSRINWVVQSSGVDYLHLLLVCMKWLCSTYDIDARFSISIHDEVRYLVTEKDRYRLALALQISNLYTRSLFAYKLGMPDLPQSVGFFSAVDVDTCMRKEVFLDCKTPSNELGMEKGYGIPPGEALSIQQVLEKTGASLVANSQPGNSEQELRSNDQNQQVERA